MILLAMEKDIRGTKLRSSSKMCTSFKKTDV
jgi:hypothetical protein